MQPYIVIRIEWRVRLVDADLFHSIAQTLYTHKGTWSLVIFTMYYRTCFIFIPSQTHTHTHMVLAWQPNNLGHTP